MLSSATERIKFEFGRHETFAVREGWIPKGLDLTRKLHGHFRPDLSAADALGLGSNMVKSLSYWLEATGLAVGTREGKEKAFRTTRFGEAVSQRDGYLEFPVSWWLMHILLARREGSVWNWFFNDFSERIFDRTTAAEAYLKSIRERALNPATPAVAQRDVACLLNAYATTSGSERSDPEDATTCPLRALSLVVKHPDTGRFEKTRPLDQIPVEAFLACCSFVASDTGSDSVAFIDLMRLRNSPARLFGLDGDAIDEMASAAASLYRQDGVGIAMLGTNRTLSLPRFDASEWLERHFARLGFAA
ncbi:DUF4007 family protein [Bosea sp. F3-2]|nr:DUF4007 family protein [Bosea sp. F3-2]